MNRVLWWRKIATQSRKHGRFTFWKKKSLKVRSERVQSGLLLERNLKVIPCRGAKNVKGMGTNDGKSGTMNLEDEYQKQNRKHSRIKNTIGLKTLLRLFI